MNSSLSLSQRLRHRVRFDDTQSIFALAFLLLLAPAFAGTPLLWRDPGAVDQLDFGGTLNSSVKPPRPPFTYQSEDLSGTQPKLTVRDANGTTWNVKFGYEVKPESFAWRLVAACGYFAQPNFYIREGIIQSPGDLHRKPATLDAAGRFTDARFQLRDPGVRFVKGQSWHWDRNPFQNTRELKGLKILLMLLSNYDNKDSRVGSAGGSNTGMFELASDRGKPLLYAFTDWGSTMGRWGDKKGQSDWRCEHFAEQTPQFVKGVRNGRVLFGFEGHIPNFGDGISVGDVRWLLTYLGAVRDEQLRAGLAASGASPQEVDCFAKALRDRIRALQNVAKPN